MNSTQGLAAGWNECRRLDVRVDRGGWEFQREANLNSIGSCCVLAWTSD